MKDHLAALHQSLLLDRERTEAYHRAIAETVEPGDVVLDLGSGTGILALFACQAGAARVYAIESGPAVEFARVLCEANGCADRVRLIPQVSAFVRLPERADVMVTETMGGGGLEEGILGWVLDGRERMLKPGGRIVPSELEIFTAPVELAELSRQLGVWSSGNYGLDLAPIRPLAANSIWHRVVREEDCLAPPKRLARFALGEFTEAHLQGEAAFRARRAGSLLGLACWFRARLSASVSLTNAPPLRTPSWNHLILPLERELAVKADDRIGVAISSFDGGEWRWRVSAEPADGGPAVRLDQATLWSRPLSLGSMRERFKSRQPQATDTTRAVHFLAGQMDGTLSVAELERRLLAEFPDLFPTARAAALFVAKLLPRMT